MTKRIKRLLKKHQALTNLWSIREYNFRKVLTQRNGAGINIIYGDLYFPKHCGIASIVQNT